MEELAALVQALLIVLFVGGLSLLAQWGRKNRGAEISLIVILLFLSSLMVALIVFMVALGVIPAPSTPALSASSAAVIVLAGLAGLALCVPPLRKVTGRRGMTASYDIVAPGHEGSTPAESRSFGDRAGDWWSDPPIFFALWLSVVVLAGNAISLLAFMLEPEPVDSILTSTGRYSPFTVLVGQLPLALIALCGIGLGVQRNIRESLVRLGYGPITLPQLGIVALFVVVSLLLSLAADALFSWLQPDLFERVGEISRGLFSPEGLSPVSAILFALLIGIGAGVGEETLFRGAVQPALGITLTSVLWVSLHVQYGPSLILGYIFVLSIGLGILRKHINTTATFLAHTVYNSLGVLLTYFFGV